MNGFLSPRLLHAVKYWCIRTSVGRRRTGDERTNIPAGMQDIQTYYRYHKEVFIESKVAALAVQQPNTTVRTNHSIHKCNFSKTARKGKSRTKLRFPSPRTTLISIGSFTGQSSTQYNTEWIKLHQRPTAVFKWHSQSLTTVILLRDFFVKIHKN